MKISKLFHYLYASVMLLPLFAIGFSCLITTFNMSAKEEAEIVYKYESNEVSSQQDLKVGNIYHYRRNDLTNGLNFLNCGNIYNIVTEGNASYETENNNFFSLTFYSPNSIYVNSQGIQTGIMKNTYFEADIVFYGLNNNDNYSYYSQSSFNIIDDIETHNVEARDVFYQSINDVASNPLFSWAENSFLVTPFAYIVSLFSMPSNSVIVILLSYWLAISIIWLVFDLVMYVPLLIHRWIDKGVLE